MNTGTVSKYFPGKGFGFLTDDSGSTGIFFHISAVDCDEVRVGDRVEFETKMSLKGLKATKVLLLEEAEDEIETIGG